MTDTSSSDLAVAVAIPTYLREEPLVRTLAQLDSQCGLAVQFVVVDQSRTHGPATHSALKSLCESRDCQWIRTRTPSLTKARNLALAATAADVVLFLDDDVIVSSGIVEAHLRHYENPAVAAVSGNVIQANRDVAELPFEVARASGVPHLTNEYPQPWEHLVGANFSVRRNTAVAVGGFDEAFVGPANFEENDFAARLLRHGGRIVADSRAAVVHLRWPAGGCRQDGALKEWMRSYNYLLYALRHVREFHELLNILGQAYRLGPGRPSLKARPLDRIRALAGLASAACRALIQWRKGPKSPWSVA